MISSAQHHDATVLPSASALPVRGLELLQKSRRFMASVWRLWIDGSMASDPTLWAAVMRARNGEENDQ